MQFIEILALAVLILLILMALQPELREPPAT